MSLNDIRAGIQRGPSKAYKQRSVYRIGIPAVELSLSIHPHDYATSTRMSMITY